MTTDAEFEAGREAIRAAHADQTAEYLAQAMTARSGWLNQRAAIIQETAAKIAALYVADARWQWRDRGLSRDAAALAADERLEGLLEAIHDATVRRLRDVIIYE